MKLIIFGASSRTGKELVKQALNDGYFVTAFTRDRTNVDISHSNLKIIEGNVLEHSTVENAINGHDAVLCTLGAGRKGHIRAEGTNSIIKAMEHLGLRRLVCQTTLGAGESKGNLNFFWKHIMFGMLLKEAFKDHEIQESYISQSNLDWTIVRPGAFTNGPKTGNYKHGFSGNDKSLSLKISCADVADFMLKELHNKIYIKKAPGLSY